MASAVVDAEVDVEIYDGFVTANFENVVALVAPEMSAVVLYVPLTIIVTLPVPLTSTLPEEFFIVTVLPFASTIVPAL